MGKDFLYLKVKSNGFFENSPNPQDNNIIIYPVKDDNNNLILMAKTEEGEYKKISSSTDLLENDLKIILRNIVGHEIESSSDSSNSSESSYNY